MAKIRVPLQPIMVGQVGGFSYYERNREQVVRQAKNVSNVGESASRSVAQQTQRAKWANVVNFWKVVSQYLRQGFEYKKSNQTDYNRFMQLNMSPSPIYLTKQMAEGGMVVPYGYQVTEGSFSPIGAELSNPDSPVSSVTTTLLSNIDASAETTWGAMSQSIISNNPEWQNGDNLAVIALELYLTALGISKLRVVYLEETIDTASTKRLADSQVGSLISYEGAEETIKTIVVGYPASIDNPAGIAVIHARRSGSLKVSSEHIFVAESLYRNRTTEAAVLEAIESYGLNAVVELDPN